MSQVNWQTAEEVIRMIEVYNQVIQGMTPAVAAAALGFTKTASGMYVKSVVTTTAASAVAEGAAAAAPTAAATTSAANLVIYEGVGGAAQVGGLGAVALPIAAGAIAAAGGYLIGAEISRRNDEFLSKLLFPLFDFVTGQNIADTLYEQPEVPTMPVIFDTAGNTYMDSRAHDRIKDILDTESALVPVTTYTQMPNLIGTIYAIDLVLQYPIDLASRIQISKTKGDPIPIRVSLAWNTSRDLQIVVASTTNFSSQGLSIYDGTSYSKTVKTVTASDGTTIWFVSRGGGSGINPLNPADAFKNFISTIQTRSLYEYDIALTLFGKTAATSSSSGGLPSGVTKYVPGTSPAPLTFPEEVPAWKPVILPKTAPTEMPEPTPTPDPDNEPDKKKKITPFIPPKQPQPAEVPVKKPAPDYVPAPGIVSPPVPNPTPNPSTTPSPAPNPSVDPSVDPSPNPDPTPTPGVTPGIPQVPSSIPEPVDEGVNPPSTLPVIPSIGTSAAGLLHVYNPSASEVQQFGQWLWTTFSSDLIDTLSKLFNNPMDAVIGLHEIYCTPVTSGFSMIKAGYLESNVSSRLVSERYKEISCGAVGVPEYWGNYLDYAPYTKCYCYLPFIGIVELNADDIMNRGVEIVYRIDIYTGSCIAMIKTAKSGGVTSVIYEFQGNCAVELPITSGQKSAIQGALLTATTAALSAATAGATSVGSAAIVGGARGAAHNKNMVQHSGSFGSSYGAMGIKTPYLIIKRPKQKVVPGYNENYGYPAHKMVHISACTGYLKAIEVDVISPTATEEEKKLIETSLKSGIFVN